LIARNVTIATIKKQVISAGVFDRVGHEGMNGPMTGRMSFVTIHHGSFGSDGAHFSPMEPARFFKHATARRIAANLVEFLEADATPVGASVAGATFATASVTGRTLRAESVADRNRPHSRNLSSS